MKIETVKAIITGGAGGIGGGIAAEFVAHGAHVMLVDRDAKGLQVRRTELATHADRVHTVTADLTNPSDRRALCTEARDWHGGVNVLVNNAGINHFSLFEDQSEAQIDLAIALNIQAPIQLCRDMLPYLRKRERAGVVNIGSVFGAIGYPGYVTYSATKFALRGFTEALRRELAGSSVTCHYIAPRATRTPINSPAVEMMNKELGAAMDTPQRVGMRVRALLAADAPRAVIGWPETLFVRLNGLFPGLVDRALRRQLPIIRRYAQPLRDAPTSPFNPSKEARISS